MHAIQPEDIGLLLPAGLPLAQLAHLCWHGTATVRRGAHIEHGRSRCPTTAPPYGDTDPRGARVKDVCRADDCLDAYHDVLVTTGERLRRRWTVDDLPADPVRYAAAIVPTIVADRGRSARIAMGWPAKPTRADGKAAIVNAHLVATAADTASGQWYLTLFRIMRGYATRPGRRHGTWPLDGLAQEKSRHLPPSCLAAAASHTVRADIEHVLRVAEAAVGKTWVHQMIWHPLLRGASPVGIPHDLLAPGGELEDQVLTRWFYAEYLARRIRGQTLKEAFRAAARVVSGRDVPEPDMDMQSLLRELEYARN